MFLGWKRDEFDAARPWEDVTYRSDLSSGFATGYGLLAGTLVSTPQGWRGVEAIAVGDEVMTFDGGLQSVIGISRNLLWTPIEECPEALWPVSVPQGMIGNSRDMQLLPDEVVMIESDLAEQLFDDPFALIPAQAIEGLPGVQRVRPMGYTEVVSLSFEKDELVFVEGGALLLCPSFGATQTVSLECLMSDESANPYTVLSVSDARKVVAAHLGQLGGFGAMTSLSALASMAA